ncbi:MAG: M28 family peptidase [Victivallales bacterium]|nr:M28 family peptidase [Victivallales bacterium]
MIASKLALVSLENLRRDLFHICRDPFSFRTVSYTAPWHSKNSLDEMDDFLLERLNSLGVATRVVENRVRPYRCDERKPLHHWYSAPYGTDTSYPARSIEAVLPGSQSPEEIIQLIAHKDSQSWINSPGAQDNATGTVVNLELIRVLALAPHRRTIRFLFCNEEHYPWHSAAMAKDARNRGDDIFAVLNSDSFCGKSDEDQAAGRKTLWSVYSTPEGKPLAELVVALVKKYQLPLEAFVGASKCINDDDGSYIQAGFRCTVVNQGSFPYADSQYHLRGDIPERVDLENLRASAQAVLATVLELDEHGRSIVQ